MEYLERELICAKQKVRDIRDIRRIMPQKWYVQRGIAQTMKRALAGRTNCRVIELGSGGSLLPIFLGPNYQYIGIDYSSIANSYAKFLMEVSGRIWTIVQEDIFSINSLGKFDIVFSSGVIEHFNVCKQLEFIKKCRDLSCYLIHCEAPNYGPNSRFYPIYKKTRKIHQDYNLRSLFRQADIILNVLDARGIFGTTEEIARCPKLGRFLAKKFPDLNIDDYMRLSARRLHNMEDSLSLEERLSFGFQHFAIGKTP